METRYFEGQEAFVSRLITGIAGVIVWLVAAISILTKSP